MLKIYRLIEFEKIFSNPHLLYSFEPFKGARGNIAEPDQSSHESPRFVMLSASFGGILTLFEI